MKYRLLSVVALSALAAAAASEPVYAQQSVSSTDAVATDDGEDIIIVQARRRNERLQDVPLSVTALSDEALKDGGVTDITGIQTYTPGLNVAQGVDSNTARFFIRGIGTATPTVGIEPAVPVYIDDVYTPSGLGSNINLFAIDRVEVLRGPQGTLYGRNSFGGAIKVYTKSLTDEADGYVEATVGDNNRRNLKAEVSTPIIPGKLWISGGAAYITRDGYQRFANTGGRGGGEDTQVFKGKVKFQPVDSLQFTFAYDLTKSDAAAKQPKITSIGNPVFNAGVLAAYPGIVSNLGQSSLDPDVIDSDVVGNSKVDAEGFTWTAAFNPNDNITLKYLGSSRSLQNIRIFDIEGTAAPFLTVNEDFRLKGDSHELQLNYESDRLNLVAGAFFYKENTRSRSAEVNNFLQFLDTGRLARIVIDPTGRATAVDIRRIFEGLSQQTKSTALYLNGSFEVTDKLNVSAGIRWTKDDKATQGNRPSITFVGGSLANFSSNASFTVPAGATIIDTTFGAQLSGQRDFKAITPEFTIDYKANPNLLLYASFKRGFQAGTFFPASNVVPGSALSTDEQLVDAYELGAKGTYFDGALQLNAALYHYKFKDLIVSVSTAVPIAVSATGFAGVPQNAGAARSQGIELESRLRVADGLNLTANIAYNDFKIKEVLTNNNGTITNIANTFLDVPTLAPKWQGNIGFDYEADLGDIGSLRLFTNAAFRSKMGINAANASESSGIGLVGANPVTDQFFVSKATTDVSAGVTFKSADENWRVDLVGRNLLNERRPVASIAVVPGFFGAIQQFNDPVNWSLSVTRKF